MEKSFAQKMEKVKENLWKRLEEEHQEMLNGVKEEMGQDWLLIEKLEREKWIKELELEKLRV